jgi:heme/copper-type cytochrome/quinol oxidase subunit 2
MAALMFPLSGIFLLITVAVSVLAFAALIGVLLQPATGFVAADKQTKLFWIMLLVLGAFVPVIGVIAAIVYFVDVRPAVAAASGSSGGKRSGGGSSSDGPYGPSRR